jgi:hypothetical protein
LEIREVISVVNFLQNADLVADSKIGTSDSARETSPGWRGEHFYVTNMFLGQHRDFSECQQAESSHDALDFIRMELCLQDKTRCVSQLIFCSFGKNKRA